MTFATLGNVVNAAQTLGISQPALSRQLQQLEDLVGEKLFQKQGRQKVLSPIGQELFSRITPTWLNYDPLVDSVISQFKDSPQNPLRIYGPAEILNKVALHIEFPHSLIFTPTRSQAVVTKVAGEEISLGITRLPPDNLQVAAKVLFKEGFQYIYPAKWKIAPMAEMRLLKKLEAYPLVSYGEDFNFPEEIWGRFELGPAPRLIRVLPSWDSLQTMVENGLGWAIAPSNLVKKSSKILSQDVSADLMPHVTYHLLYKKDLIRIPWFKTLVNELLNAYK